MPHECEATKLSVSRALKGEPSVDGLIANRKTVKRHSMDGVIDTEASGPRRWRRSGLHGRYPLDRAEPKRESDP